VVLATRPRVLPDFTRCRRGRRQLNLSTWGQYDARRKTRKLREISEQVQQGKMPQWYYLLLHPDVRLSVEDRQLLVDWAKQP
jgi:hypothetical protein